MPAKPRKSEPQFDSYNFRSSSWQVLSILPAVMGDLAKTQHAGAKLQSGRNAAKAVEFMIALINERRIDGRNQAFSARDPHGRLVDAARQAHRMGWLEVVGSEDWNEQAVYMLTEDGRDFMLKMQNSVQAANLFFQRVLGALIADAASGVSHEANHGTITSDLNKVSSYHTGWQFGVESVKLKNIVNPSYRVLNPPVWAHGPIPAA